MVAAAAIGALGSLGAAGINIFGNSQSQSQAGKKAAELAILQYILNMQALREQYSNARQGLEKAGYNPILAATNGVQVAGNMNGGSVGTPSNPASDIGDNIINGLQYASNMKLQQAQTEQTNASTENIQADTANKTVQKGLYELDKQYRDNEIKLQKKDLDTYDRRFLNEQNERIARTKHMLEDARLMNYRATSERIVSNAKQMDAETNRGMSDSGVKFGPFGSNVKHYVPENMRFYKNATSAKKVRSYGYNNYSYRNYQ